MNTTLRTLPISDVRLDSLLPSAPEDGDLRNYSSYNCIQLFVETRNYRIKQHSSELNLHNAVRSRIQKRRKDVLAEERSYGCGTGDIKGQDVFVSGKETESENLTADSNLF